MKKVLSSLKFKNFALLTLAGIINAFGITVFLSPVNLYDSGISGTSMLIDQVTPEYITLSIALLVLNIPLFMADQTDRLIGLALMQRGSRAHCL